MRITGTAGDLRQTLKDLIALKAGLIVTDGELINHLNQAYDRQDVWGEPGGWWTRDHDTGVSVRAEELERDFILLMHELGAIPDRRGPKELVMDRLQEVLPEAMDEDKRRMYVVANAASLHLDIVRGETVPGFEEIVPEVRRRWILDQSSPENREWDGAIELGELFKSEEVPDGADAEQQLDQRFIDYLAAEPERLQDIHWRQFEYLCGEYFGRRGYEVEVTPPRGDEGIDVYARKDDAAVGPELIVIQAKRQTEPYTVSIDQVKAFWTDIGEQDATRGVVATTTRLEQGAREFCEARRYRLTGAEAEDVSSWLREMTTLTDR